jgi:hypothetical protein
VEPTHLNRIGMVTLISPLIELDFRILTMKMHLQPNKVQLSAFFLGNNHCHGHGQIPLAHTGFDKERHSGTTYHEFKIFTI